MEQEQEQLRGKMAGLTVHDDEEAEKKGQKAKRWNVGSSLSL